MTLEEKIASVPKLERIDSSIDSCIKILREELRKRDVQVPNWDTSYLLKELHMFETDFNIMRGKK